ncbi:hypothetical protein [Halobaculum sp. EA56]|uniref:hypothetical protein n=1 Tax=Halobaculum sp. EA56 TaxID=3421648 RepID=UPI003EBEF082
MPSTRLDRGQWLVLGLVSLIVLGAVWAGLGPTVRYHLRPDSDPAAVAAADRATAAVETVDAYRVVVDGEATATRGDRTATATLDGTVSVNATARRMRIHTTADDDDPFGDDATTLTLDGFTAYRPCPYSRYSNVANASYAVDLPRNRSWRAYTFLGGLGAAFDAAKLYDEGVESVDGEPAREVRVVLHPGRTDDLAQRTASLPGAHDGSRISPLTAPGSADVRVWISTESGLPLRFEIRIDRSRLGGADVTARFTYDVTYEPATVSLPNRTVADEDDCPMP